MKAGLSMGTDKEGNVTSVRLMGPPDYCGRVEMPWDPAVVRWCAKWWPHSDEPCEYSQGPASWL